MDNFPVLSKEQNKELTELKQELKETVENIIICQRLRLYSSK